MRAGGRVRSALVLTVMAGVAACGGSSFTLADAGMDAESSGPDARSSADAGHKEDGGGGTRPDAKSHDASDDRGTVADVTVPKDATSGTDAGHDATTGMDAVAPLDAPVTMDATHPPDAHVSGDGGCGVNKTTTFATDRYLMIGGNGGTPGNTPGCVVSAPCGSLDIVMGVAKPGDTIYIGNGTYTASSPLALREATNSTGAVGMSILGGWTTNTSGLNWVQACNPTASAVTINVAGQEVATVGSESPSVATTTLANLTLVNTSAATAGQSLYGIVAVGTVGVSELVLDNVTVTVPSGGPGAAGPTGVGATAVGGGCSGAGGTGAAGTNGSAGSATSYGASGASSGSQGSAGTAGQSGATGPVGTRGCTSAPEPTSCVMKLVGATEECSLGTTAIVCTSIPEGGCGGGGGPAEPGGSGGGSSIAVYSWSENLTIAGGTLSAGAGGAGGSGGMASGGPGGSGEGQTSAKYVLGCNGTTCQPASEGTVTSVANGGPGETGGDSGQGGGGAGGDSYAYYLGNGATAVVTGSPSFTPSNAVVVAVNNGGAPNGNGGQSGVTN